MNNAATAAVTNLTNIIVEMDAEESIYVREAINFASDEGNLNVVLAEDTLYCATKADADKVFAALDGMYSDALDGVAWCPSGLAIMEHFLNRLGR